MLLVFVIFWLTILWGFVYNLTNYRGPCPGCQCIRVSTQGAEMGYRLRAKFGLRWWMPDLGAAGMCNSQIEQRITLARQWD